MLDRLDETLIAEVLVYFVGKFTTRPDEVFRVSEASRGMCRIVRGHARLMEFWNMRIARIKARGSWNWQDTYRIQRESKVGRLEAQDILYERDPQPYPYDATEDMSTACVVLAYQRFGVRWGASHERKRKRYEEDLAKMNKVKQEAAVYATRYAPMVAKKRALDAKKRRKK